MKHLVLLDSPDNITKKYIPIEVFCAMGYYSVEAVRKKISRHQWLQNQEWCKAPDGRIYIDMEGFYKWVARGTSLP